METEEKFKKDVEARETHIDNKQPIICQQMILQCAAETIQVFFRK